MTIVIILLAVVINISGAEAQNEGSVDSVPEEHALDIDNWSIGEAEVEIEKCDVTREYKGKFHNERYNDICLVKYNDVIDVFGTQILLYPTFINQREAIRNASVIMKDFLDSLAQENDLASLSEGNLGKYEAATYARMDNLSSEEEYKDCFLFLGFLDIYYNEKSNDEIKQLLSSYEDANERVQIKKTFPSGFSEKGSEELLDAMIFDAIRLSLPDHTSEKFAKITEVENSLATCQASRDNIRRTSSSYSQDRAKNYASTYATNPNLAIFSYVFNSDGVAADCTNFVSQILFSGGKSMDRGILPTSGWWFSTNLQVPTTYSYSRAWVGAEYFANYWGIDYVTGSHKGFSKVLRIGDCIAADYAYDSDWNHWGFVTNRETFDKEWSPGYCYNDYKVAQHGKDYHHWTSNNNNDWEHVTDNGGILGILKSSNW